MALECTVSSRSLRIQQLATEIYHSRFIKSGPLLPFEGTKKTSIPDNRTNKDQFGYLGQSSRSNFRELVALDMQLSTI